MRGKVGGSRMVPTMFLRKRPASLANEVNLAFAMVANSSGVMAAMEFEDRRRSGTGGATSPSSARGMHKQGEVGG